MSAGGPLHPKSGVCQTCCRRQGSVLQLRQPDPEYLSCTRLSTLDTRILRLEAGDQPHSHRSAAIAALVPPRLGCYESVHPHRPAPRLALRRLRSQIVTPSPPSLPSNNFCFTCRALHPSHTLGSLSLRLPYLISVVLWHLCTTSLASAAAPTVAWTTLTALRPALPKPDHRRTLCGLPSAVCQSVRLLRYCVDNGRHRLTRPGSEWPSPRAVPMDMDVIQPQCSAVPHTILGRQFLSPAIGLGEPSCA